MLSFVCSWATHSCKVGMAEGMQLFLFHAFPIGMELHSGSRPKGFAVNSFFPCSDDYSSAKPFGSISLISASLDLYSQVESIRRYFFDSDMESGHVIGSQNNWASYPYFLYGHINFCKAQFLQLSKRANHSSLINPALLYNSAYYI